MNEHPVLASTQAGNRTGQRALVVGGSTGIGMGLAVGLDRAGYEVHVVSRSTPMGTDASTLHWHECDLIDQVQTADVLRDIATEPLGVVCFAAAYYGKSRHQLVDTPEIEWRRQVDVMMHGLWLTLNHSLPALVAEASSTPGLLLSVSSEVVFNGGPQRSGYAAVKAAASALLRSVRQEYPSDMLSLVEVLPQGMVDSPGIRSRRPDGFDYSTYMTPEDFYDVGYELGRSRGVDLDGTSLVIQPGGKWAGVKSGTIPPSQSRAGAS